ncbi:MAG: 23S rRNA (uracil(1939)-C(5))-methyltransferase RlmD, partial [Oscillospiraceae bacterium]
MEEQKQLVKNSLHTVTIEGISSEGMGVARIDGMVVFVTRAVAGETCVIQITRADKHCAFAKINEITTLSPHRIPPSCPHFGQCGGCDFLHMDYAAELTAKHQRVEDALRRIGGSDVAVEEILGAEHPLHYRNKSQYPVSKDGEIGFFRARTHQVVPVERCLIGSHAADLTVAAVGDYLRAYQVPAYDETTNQGLLRHVYVRTNGAGESLCCLLVNGAALPHEDELVELLRAAVPQLAGVVLGINRKAGNGILGHRYRTLWGQDFLMDSLCGLDFKLSVPSFYQVNREQAERLYHKALDFAALTGQETVLDLYCGIGTITLALAQKAKQVIGAELIAAAIHDAEGNARRNGIENVSFLCGDAAEIAVRLTEEGLHPDVVTVDPPRKGLTEETVNAVAALAPSRIVYVSCDPATLARDVKRFAALGY